MGFVLNCSGRDNTLITLSKGFGCTVQRIVIPANGVSYSEFLKNVRAILFSTNKRY